MRPVLVSVGDGSFRVDQALPGPRLRDLDAFQFRVRPQDGDLDRERGGGVVCPLAA
jgi:hypothetical protein